MIDQLGELYRDVILQHFQHAANRGSLPDATISIQGANTLCGDELSYQLRLKGGKIDAARFTGNGCAISQAAASMLAEQLEGRTPDEARQLIGAMKKVMQGQHPDDGVDLGDLEALVGVRKFPVRVKCAALSWNVVEQGLDKHEGKPAAE